MIINSETGKKLSKRDTNTLQFIEDYRKKGYLPEAVFNFIALLGWNPGGEDEIFSREELIKLFDENRLSKSPAAFDQKKMDWMSNEYIKNADLATIFEMAKPFLEEAGRLTDKAEKFGRTLQATNEVGGRNRSIDRPFLLRLPRVDRCRKRGHGW